MFANYMMNTWISASLIAAVSAVIGFFVVLRREAFASHAIPNGAFAGAAGAALIGTNIFIGLGVFSILTALGISFSRVKAKADTGTALALVTFLALGSAFMSQNNSSGSTAYSLLFGQILGVSRTQILTIGIFGLFVVLCLLIFHSEFTITAIFPEIAVLRGINVKRVEIIFLLLVALTTTVSVPLVGSMLVFLLIIAPAASARKITSIPSRAILYSVIFSLLIVWTAIAFSYLTNWPISFYVSIAGIGLYLISSYLSKVKVGSIISTSQN